MDEKQNEWITRNRLAADDAVRLLVSAKKQRLTEYDERLRLLKDLQEVLYVKQNDKQDELFSHDEVMNVTTIRLLENPLIGLEDATLTAAMAHVSVLESKLSAKTTVGNHN